MSGVLFTANNFIINQFQVIVSDAVLVRCIIQIFIYSVIIFWNDDKLLPQDNKKKLFTISQGIFIYIVRNRTYNMRLYLNFFDKSLNYHY